jgi:hypothetical protein
MEPQKLQIAKVSWAKRIIQTATPLTKVDLKKHSASTDWELRSQNLLQASFETDQLWGFEKLQLGKVQDL